MSDHSKTESCLVCEGSGWLHRQVPSPTSPGKMTTVTRTCRFCNGKGSFTPQPVFDGRARAAGNDD